MVLPLRLSGPAVSISQAGAQAAYT